MNGYPFLIVSLQDNSSGNGISIVDSEVVSKLGSAFINILAVPTIRLPFAESYTVTPLPSLPLQTVHSNRTPDHAVSQLPTFNRKNKRTIQTAASPARATSICRYSCTIQLLLLAHPTRPHILVHSAEHTSGGNRTPSLRDDALPLSYASRSMDEEL